MDESRRVMKLNKIAATLLIASLLISCGGGSAESGSSSKSESPAEDGVIRVITYDSQKFNEDMYEASEGLVKIEYVLDGFQSHTLVIEGEHVLLRELIIHDSSMARTYELLIASVGAQDESSTTF